MGHRIRDLIAAKQRPDTPEEIAERIRNRRAGELAHADMLARFPVLDASNAQEAIDFQDERIAWHRKALAAEEGSQDRP